MGVASSRAWWVEATPGRLIPGLANPMVGPIQIKGRFGCKKESGEIESERGKDGK